MAKVYQFPVKMQLPTEIEERLAKVAREYVKTAALAMTLMCDGEPSDSEYEELTNLMLVAYAKALSNAIDELNEEG